MVLSFQPSKPILFISLLQITADVDVINVCHSCQTWETFIQEKQYLELCKVLKRQVLPPDMVSRLGNQMLRKTCSSYKFQVN